MIFEYHSIVPNTNPPARWRTKLALTASVFEQHVRYLAKHYEIVSLEEYLSIWKGSRAVGKRKIALTLDDGYGETFQCVFAMLEGLKIPATIFTPICHLENGELLYFSYLKALCFEKIYECIEVNHQSFMLKTFRQCSQAWAGLLKMANTSGNPHLFSQNLAKRYPLPSGTAAFYRGMTFEQLLSAGSSDFIEIGAHTISHPILSQLPKELQDFEIRESKRILSELTKKEVRYFAYPAGEYNEDSIHLIKAAGYQAAFAEIPKNIGVDREFEIGRVGIYSPSLVKLGLKAMGVASVERRFNLRIG